MELLILTGMSGAGKSRVKDYLEDMGYFCIDNLPAPLLKNLALNFFQANSKNDVSKISKIAFIVDARSYSYFADLAPHIVELKNLENKDSLQVRLIFLDASDAVLLSRYKQTRRAHPLSQLEGRGTLDAIKLERELLVKLKLEADYIIDTSNYNLQDLRNYTYKLLSSQDDDMRMTVCVLSFGFKYGLPLDCDLVEDIRFLPNPYYDVNLRPLSGLDGEVKDFVLKRDITQAYLELTKKRLELLLPAYLQEGKVRLTIGVGCTGGRHRSVAIANYLADLISSLGYPLRLWHRDLQKDLQNITKIEDYKINEHK